MERPVSLSRIFLDRLGGRRAEDLACLTESIDSTLQALERAGREAWPGVPLSAEAFASHIADRVRTRADVVEAISTMHAADIFLACACSCAIPAALSVFERDQLSRVPDLVRRIDSAAAFADEVTQTMREMLLVPAHGAETGIAEYSGRGALSNWVRIIAVRTALRLRREQRSPGTFLEAESELPGTLDPELDYLKLRYRGAYEEALHVALASLPDRDALLLSRGQAEPDRTPESRDGSSARAIIRYLVALLLRILHAAILRSQLDLVDVMKRRDPLRCPRRALRQWKQAKEMTMSRLLCLPRYVLVGVALFASSGAVRGASSIVDTAYVADAIARGAIIWDTRSAAAYKQGHIPGAVNIDDVGMVLRDENTEDYIALERISALLGGAGIDPKKQVLVYGAKANPYVYFALVTLEYLNAVDPKIYHGGIEDWKSAGRPITTEMTRLEPVTLKLTVNPTLLVDTAEVVRRLHDPKVQILDARTQKEYSGEEIRAIRGGHIPGAIPIHYMENWIDPDARSKIEKKDVSNFDGLNLKSREQLQALYAKLDPNKETIVYCQSGIRASESATILKELGFKKVRVYDSSWLGYGNTLDAPAQNVTFYNVGLIQSKMTSLQRRLETLEKALAETKAGKEPGKE